MSFYLFSSLLRFCEWPYSLLYLFPYFEACFSFSFSTKTFRQSVCSFILCLIYQSFFIFIFQHIFLFSCFLTQYPLILFSISFILSLSLFPLSLSSLSFSLSFLSLSSFKQHISNFLHCQPMLLRSQAPFSRLVAQSEMNPIWVVVDIFDAAWVLFFKFSEKLFFSSFWSFPKNIFLLRKSCSSDFKVNILVR